MNPVLEYRRDIDGLRALAVIPVVLFHSGLGVFPGGYVGVDVFFVISGYLISSIILREIQRDQFSLSTFYCRRIKRIFPALFFMLFASVLVASVFFTAKDFNELGKSLYTVLLFYSNFYFFDKQGYFDIGAEEQLFLHTWSLSVEEQFYIIFPALLLLLFRVNARIIKAVLLSLFVLSLTFSALVTWTEPSKAFYFSPLRFWELLCGVLLALGIFPKVKRRFSIELFSILGLCLLIVPMLIYDDGTAFPGLAALPVCLGTCLLIYSGSLHQTFVAKLLSAKLLVFFGLISYSLYLWHWPVFVFREYLYLPDTVWVSSLLIGVSILLAWFSWRFVERPFRGQMSASFFGTNKQVFRIAVVCGVVFLSIALLLDGADGLPLRYPENIQQLFVDEERHPKFRKCGGVNPENNRELSECALGAENVPVRFALWGDSHAEAIAPAVDKIAVEYGVAGYYFSKSACLPIVKPDEVVSYVSQRCDDYHRGVLEFIENSSIKDVILAGRWNSPNADLNPYELAEGLDVVMSALTRKGIRVWFMRQVPEAGVDVPRVMLRNHILPISSLPLLGEPRVREERLKSRMVMDSLRQQYAYRELDPERQLCSQACSIQDNGRSLYKDEHHLSVYGALYISELFRPVFNVQ